MTVMLDTDICIYTIKRKPVSVLKRLERCQSGMVVMSVITFAELVNGAKKSRYVEDNLNRLNELSELIEVLPFGKNAAMAYGDVRSDLEKRGLVIGGNDLLIAAHALSLNYPLVTNNQREFSRVKGLLTENWVAEDPAADERL
jgi:tRNA(fMet)-specific endonuclease VapC